LSISTFCTFGKVPQNTTFWLNYFTPFNI
jgi:hypothetical protein